jgi:hypothetical protein
MKDIITKTIAGVLAGIILYFIIDRYLSKDKELPEEVKHKTESITPNETQQQAQQPPLEESPQPAKTQSQPTQNVPPIENTKPQVVVETKQVEAAKPIERKLESTFPQVDHRSVEQSMDLITKEARVKRDSLGRDKKLNQEVKKVERRANDAFDELEKELDPLSKQTRPVRDSLDQDNKPSQKVNRYREETG